MNTLEVLGKVHRRLEGRPTLDSLHTSDSSDGVDQNMLAHEFECEQPLFYNDNVPNIRKMSFPAKVNQDLLLPSCPTSSLRLTDSKHKLIAPVSLMVVTDKDVPDLDQDGRSTPWSRSAMALAGIGFGITGAIKFTEKLKTNVKNRKR